MDRLKRWCSENWWLWITICIIELFLIIYFYFNRVRNIALKMVLDSNGNFNWTVVTAITAIIAIVFAWINNNKNIKANLVSKSRIEWIQEVRKISVDFLGACHNVNSLIIKISKSKSESYKNSIIFIEEEGRYAEVDNQYSRKHLIEEQFKVEKFGALLSLYFGPDKSKNNELIVYLIEQIILRISKTEKIFEEQKATSENMIEELKNVLRIYFKVEWKRSIGEIADSSVDSELEKSEIYKSIKSKYEKDLEDKDKTIKDD